MLKYFILLSIIYSSSVYAMQDEPQDTQPKNSKYGLIRHADKELPTEFDIQFYEDLYGDIPPIMKRFYLNYGNCSKEGLDILHIYGKENSDLSKTTKLIRKHLGNNYHALAVDQAAGGYWVYTTPSYPIVELFDSSLLVLTGESLNGFSGLLKRK